MNRIPLSTYFIDPEIESLLQRLKQHDHDTFTHSMRVAEYCAWFAGPLNMHQTQGDLFVVSALLHDIGKLRIPQAILNKEAKLTDDEWNEIQKHPIYGMEYVQHLVSRGLVYPDVIAMHHQNTDGTGYPYRSEAEILPKEVRMIRIIDSFDAMTSNRNYQRVKTRDEALAELQRCSGQLYDPDFVSMFCRYLTG